MKYIHFTSNQDADKIIRDGKLNESSIIVNAIYAVAVGGEFSPSVQLTGFGRVKNRDVAILFETDLLPDVAFPEEVIWHLKELSIKNASIISIDQARSLLDGSIPVNEDDLLQIPTTKKDRRLSQRDFFKF
jgi:hypothetical protein